ncbi:MAG: hypothetical protein M3348_02120, partial [Acidobacteriota bacterium]|nr:hypothetical protein [Acidobacteriota bacterium]
MKSETEIWQLMSGEEVYQADLQTLKQWIVEGLVQPTDMVRRGSLKWIEAGRAPGLRRVFTGEEQPTPPAQTDAPAAFDAQPATVVFEPAHATDAFEPTRLTAAESHAPAPASSPAPAASSQTHGASSPQTHDAASHAHEVEWPQTLADDEGAP